MANKKYTSEDAYQIEKANNERKFIEMLKLVRSDLYVLMDVLDQTKINWFVVVKIIRALNLISKNGGGDGWGEVTITLQDDRVLFVKGINADRVNEPLTLPDKLTP